MFKFKYHDDQHRRYDAGRIFFNITAYIWLWLNKHPDVYLVTGELDNTDKGTDYIRVEFRKHTKASVDAFIAANSGLCLDKAYNEGGRYLKNWLTYLHKSGTIIEEMSFFDVIPRDKLEPVNTHYFRLQEKDKRKWSGRMFLSSVIHQKDNQDAKFDPITKELNAKLEKVKNERILAEAEEYEKSLTAPEPPKPGTFRQIINILAGLAR